MGSELGVTADSKPERSITPVSIWWACWACIWTIVVALGIAYLIARRNTPILRIRGLGLSISAVIFLHLYWTSVQFGTMVGSLLPGNAEYWIMGTYLPCGIALYHASNSRFLHVAKLQKKYVQLDGSSMDSTTTWKRKGGLINRFRRLDYTTKILSFVGIAMFIQV